MEPRKGHPHLWCQKCSAVDHPKDSDGVPIWPDSWQGIYNELESIESLIERANNCVLPHFWKESDPCMLSTLNELMGALSDAANAVHFVAAAIRHPQTIYRLRCSRCNRAWNGWYEEGSRICKSCFDSSLPVASKETEQGNQ